MKNLLRYLFIVFFLLSHSSFSLDSEKSKSFVIEIGNQAIKILKIPVDDKQKRKNELIILVTPKILKDK